MATFTDYISAGALVVAVGVFIWQIVTNIKQKEYEKSGFRLTSALDAFKATHTLLNDNNNDRITWIAAVRALERGNRMASGITEEVHRDVFEVHEDKYRQILSDILGFDNPEKKGNFFYGAPADISDINEAAKYSTAHESDRPQIRFIPETTLKIFWDFTQFPEDYEDPISGNEKFSDDELEKYTNRLLWPGLFEYLLHKRKNRSIGGQLYPNESKKNDPKH